MNHYGFLIENEIFWSGLTGGWEKESLRLWIKLCQNATVVFDIGANTGIYSLISKAVNRNAVVYALEPVQRVFKKLAENNSLNNYDIKCIQAAASNSEGTALIYDTYEEHTYSVTINKNLNEEAVKVFTSEIDTLTLDGLIERENLTRLDLIKIDVETHEAEVMEGFRKHLALYKPTILIEILTDEVGKKVQQIVHGLGYLYFTIHEEHGVRQVEQISHSLTTNFNFLICSRSVAVDLGIMKGAACTTASEVQTYTPVL
ncbi:MAG: FkbM family methyltransferase [Bacteroidia bacterium]